jgi:hypothetical protein
MESCVCKVGVEVKLRKSVINSLVYGMRLENKGFFHTVNIYFHGFRIPGSLLHVDAAEAVESALEQGKNIHQRANRIRVVARQGFLEADCESGRRLDIEPHHICQEAIFWRKGHNESKSPWHDYNSGCL